MKISEYLWIFVGLIFSASLNALAIGEEDGYPSEFTGSLNIGIAVQGKPQDPFFPNQGGWAGQGTLNVPEILLRKELSGPLGGTHYSGTVSNWTYTAIFSGSEPGCASATRTERSGESVIGTRTTLTIRLSLNKALNTAEAEVQYSFIGETECGSSTMATGGQRSIDGLSALLTPSGITISGSVNDLEEAVGHFPNSVTTFTCSGSFLAVDKPCVLSPLLTSHEDPLYNDQCLTAEMKVALNAFEADVVANGGGIAVKTTACRSEEYQRHLYEVWDSFNRISRIPGYIEVTGPRGFPRQLATTSTTAECESIITRLNEEVAVHYNQKTWPSAVSRQKMPHVKGIAVDWTIFPAPSVNIDVIAQRNGLRRTEPNEIWHFELDRKQFNALKIEGHFSPEAIPNFLGKDSSLPVVVNFLIRDPEGRVLGFDKLSGGTTNSIHPEAYYSGPGTSPQILEIPSDAVLSGDYDVLATGSGSASFKILVGRSDEEHQRTESSTAVAISVVDALRSTELRLVNPALFTSPLIICNSGQTTSLVVPGPLMNATLEVSQDLSNGIWSEKPFNTVTGILVLTNKTDNEFFRLRMTPSKD